MTSTKIPHNRQEILYKVTEPYFSNSWVRNQILEKDQWKTPPSHIDSYARCNSRPVDLDFSALIKWSDDWFYNLFDRYRYQYIIIVFYIPQKEQQTLWLLCLISSTYLGPWCNWLARVHCHDRKDWVAKSGQLHWTSRFCIGAEEPMQVHLRAPFGGGLMLLICIWKRIGNLTRTPWKASTPLKEKNTHMVNNKHGEEKEERKQHVTKNLNQIWLFIVTKFSSPNNILFSINPFIVWHLQYLGY